MSSMKVTMFLAMTLNGLIARDNGSEDFLSDRNWDYFKKLAEIAGAFVVGRKTYAAVQQWTDFNFNNIEAQLKMVVSSDETIDLSPPFFLVKSPQEAIALATERGFKQLILAGGSSLNSAFLKADLLDEIILNIEPVILGKGLSLFAQENFEKRLTLVSVDKIHDELLTVKYLVNKY